MIELPFFFLPRQGFSGGIRNIIGLDLSPPPIGLVGKDRDYSAATCC